MTTPERRQPSESMQAMYDLVEALQQPLAELKDLALEIHSHLRPLAPRLINADKRKPGSFWYISSMNYHNGEPASDTLTMNIGNGSYIEMDKHSGPNLNLPIWRLDYTYPYDDDRKLVTTIKVFHEDSKAYFPLDISEALYRYDNGTCDGFIGAPYEDQDRHIQKFKDQLTAFPK